MSCDEWLMAVVLVMVITSAITIVGVSFEFWLSLFSLAAVFYLLGR